MEKFRIKATIYNIINLGTIIIFPLIFILQLSVFRWWIVLLDDDSLAVIIFWPFLIMFGILALTKSYMKKIVHDENKFHYSANNIEIDNKADKGSLTEKNIELLPVYKKTKTFRRNHLDTNYKFDLAAKGTINDLGITYKVDKFILNVSEKIGDERRNRLRFKGDAIIVDFEKVNFGESDIICINDLFANDIANNLGEITLKDYDSVQSNEAVVHLYFENEMMNEELLNKIKNILSSSKIDFNKDKHYIIFTGNRLIYLTDAQHIFKLKIPLFITKPQMRGLVSGQKAAIYKFNMLLNNIAVKFL